MNSDIQIIDMLSDDPDDCSPTDGSLGDELADTVFVTVIALGMAEMVTTVLTVAVLVTDCTSMLVLVMMAVEVEVANCVLVSTSMLVLVAMAVEVMVEVELMSRVLVMDEVVLTVLVIVVVKEKTTELVEEVTTVEFTNVVLVTVDVVVEPVTAQVSVRVKMLNQIIFFKGTMIYIHNDIHHTYMYMFGVYHCCLEHAYLQVHM